jgi:hypothetical protein
MMTRIRLSIASATVTVGTLMWAGTGQGVCPPGHTSRAITCAVGNGGGGVHIKLERLSGLLGSSYSCNFVCRCSPPAISQMGSCSDHQGQGESPATQKCADLPYSTWHNEIPLGSASVADCPRGTPPTSCEEQVRAACGKQVTESMRRTCSNHCASAPIPTMTCCFPPPTPGQTVESGEVIPETSLSQPGFSQ